jgi:hypothetical protein
MMLDSTIPRWVSTLGATLLLPPGWQDTTEYTFRAAGEEPHYLAWEDSAFDEAAAYAWLLRKREDLAQSMRDASRLSQVHELPHERFRVFGLLAPTGAGDHDPTICLFAICRPEGAALLRTRTRWSQVGWIPQMVASLAPRVPGSSTPPGRYTVLELSFAWPMPLQPPHRFRYESATGDEKLRVRTDIPHDHRWPTPAWSTAFSYASDCQVDVRFREALPVQGGMIPPPFAVQPQKLVLQQIRWHALASSAASPELSLAYCQARSARTKLGVRVQEHASGARSVYHLATRASVCANGGWLSNGCTDGVASAG